MADSFRDAFRGIWDCIKTERNMRVHTVMCVYVIFFASFLGLTRGEFACLLLSIGSVMTAETLNTSLEKLCDFTQKSTNRLIRVIKDMAAGAVLICALFAAGVGVVVLCRPELLVFLRFLVQTPLYLGLLLLSLLAALVYVFAGPVRIAESARRLFGKHGE